MNGYELAAFLFFSVFALAMVAGLIVWHRRSGYTVAQTLPYFVGELVARILWRVQVVGKIARNRGEGAVLVCNHSSSVDPVILQIAAGRVVHWMVAAEFFSIPGYNWILYITESIPTRRGGADTKAIRESIRHAAAGHLVGVLPEGRINMTDQLMLPVRPGAVMIAQKAGVPIIPCYVDGAPYDGRPYSPLYMPAKVRVVIGEPIDLSEYQQDDNEDGFAGRVMLDVIAQIAHLAGHDDFEPQLAGRRWKPTREEVEQAMAKARRKA